MLKNPFFRWNGSPKNCYDLRTLNLDEEKCTFYTSFVLNEEVFNIGDYVCVKVSKEAVIGRLLCVYETSERNNRYRGVFHLFTFAEDCSLKIRRKLLENEIVDDDLEKNISLLKIKGKCTVIIGTEEDTIDDISPGNYLLRYQLINSTLVPIVSDNPIKTTNVFNEFDKILTPKCDIASQYEIVSSPSALYVNLCEDMKETRIATPKKLTVCRNLNESFSSTPKMKNGTPILDYSLIENTADKENDGELKIKLRVSKKEKVVVVLDKLGDDLVSRFLDKDTDSYGDEVGSVRRSLRNKQRVSYAEYEWTPTKRGRKPSSDVMRITRSATKSEDINKTPQKRKETEPQIISPAKITKSSRKLHFTKDTQLETIDLTQSSKLTPPKSDPKASDVFETSPRKRKIKSPSKYHDYIDLPKNLPKKKSILKHPSNSNISTPKKSVCYEDYSDGSIPDSDSPKKKRNVRRSSPTKTPQKETPSARAKLIRDGVITPSVRNRATPVKIDTTPLNLAKTKLHVSYVPKVLACREKEFGDVYDFVEGKLLDGCGGCIYISGVPGTGKTATVTEVIKKLQSEAKIRSIPDFDYVSVNGMRLSEPRQSYVEILRQLTGKTVRWEQAQSTLDTKFTKTGHKNKPIVLLVDELDILCTKRQDVVYNLLDWPTKAKAQLIVITIANTMDLPERLLMGRVTSRLGLTRLTFQAYTHKQLQEIVIKRLSGTEAFNPDAIQLVARKVASVSGDARRALDICRRAAEIAELEGANTLVSMTHVNAALNAMITQPKIQAIKCCSRLQQLILQSIVAEVERTGVEETSFSDVYSMLISVAALDGYQMVTCTVVLRAVSRLSACRLLITDLKSHDFDQKIILNVSSDDVYYGLRKD